MIMTKQNIFENIHFKYDEQGYMRCLIGSKEYHADFFFDCSGFKGLLII